MPVSGDDNQHAQHCVASDVKSTTWHNVLKSSIRFIFVANDDQVEKAKEIIKALTSKFDPLNIENPCK